MATTQIRAQGSVAQLEGKAWVRNPDGSLRELHLGDTVTAGQTIVTAEGSRLELRGESGQLVGIDGAREVLADAEVLTQTSHGPDEAALAGQDADVARVIQALETGADPFAELDPTAAGNSGGSGSDDGNSFIRLLRISESEPGSDLSISNTSADLLVAPPLAREDNAPQGASAPTPTPPNTNPIAGSFTATTDEDRALTISLDGHVQDADGNPTRVSGTPVADHGTVTLNPDGSLNYVPDRDFNGTDTIRYTVTDGAGGSATGTITVTVTPGNDAPLVSNTVLTTQEDTAVSGAIVASDVDGDALNYTLGTGPANGNVTLNADGTFTYTPDTNYNGNDSFTVVVSDGQGGTTTSTVNIGITPVNDAPSAPNLTLTTNEDTPVTGSVAGNDVEGDALSYAKGSDPAHGTVVVNADGTFTYTPAGDYNGNDSFTVTVSDGKGGVTTPTVSVGVAPVNDAAVISGADAGAVTEDTALTASGKLDVADIDAGQASFNAQTNVAGAHGTFSIDAAGNWTYALDNADPAVQALGAGQSLPSEVFNVTSLDGTTHTVTVAITGTNDAAAISGTSTGTVTEDTTLVASGKLDITDPDAGQSSFVAGSHTGTYGSLTIDAAGNWTYALDNAAANVQLLKGGDTVTDTITVTSADGTSHAIVVSVHGADEVTSSGTGTVREDATLTSSGALTSTGGNTFVPATFNGTYGDLVVGSDGAWTYTLHNTDPAVQALAGGSSQTETFAVGVSDGTSTSVSITVLGSNDAAAFSGADAGSVTEDTALTSGKLDVADADAGQASFNAQTNVAGAHGTFSIDAAGNWTYALDNTDPAVQALGAGQSLPSEVFSVTSLDGTTHTVTVAITGTNDVATISGTNSGSVTEDAALIGGNLTASGTLAVADVDSGEAVFQTPASLTGTYGNFTFNTTTGAWTYAADNAQSSIQSLGDGESLTDSITVKSADGSASQVISVTIHGTNDAATISGTATGSASEDVAVSGGNLTASGTLAVADVDTGEAVFQTPASLVGTYGSFTFDTTTGAWTYAANNAQSAIQSLGDGESLTDSITVQSADGSASQVITVTIHGTNDVPTISGAASGSVTEDTALIASGKLDVTDVDAGQSSFVAGSHTGAYGSLVIDAAGNWTYTLDNAAANVQQLKGGDTVTDTITVTSADGTSHAIVVSVHGADEITSADTGTVREDATLTSSGTLTTTGANSFVPATLNGVYGDLVVGSDGAWTYTLHNTDPTVQALAGGSSRTETFTIGVSDGTNTSISITVLGANDAATISGSDTGSVIEDTTLTTSGKLDVSDVDAGQASFNAQAIVAGAHGTFSINAAGNWTYALDNTDPAVQALGAGQSLPSEVFTVTSLDGTTHTVTVAITGTNDAAVITPVTANLTETNAVLTTGGTLAITDIDSAATFVAQTSVAGSNGYGHFNVGTNGAWTWTADSAHNEFVAGQHYFDSITVTSADGTTSTITVDILGTNDAAVITPVTVNLTETNAVLTTGGTLAISDVDSATTFVAQTNVAGSNGFGHFNVGTDGAWTWTADSAHNEFVAGQHYSDSITVTSADGTTSTITVDILGSNDGALISGADTGAVIEDTALITSGKLNVTDVDVGQASFNAQTNVAGAHGTFSINAAGNWAYALDNADPAVQALGAGQSLPSEIFTVTSLDGTTHTVTVAITGTDDGAVISGTDSGAVTEDTALIASGKLDVTDVDAGQSSFVAGSHTGAYGSLVIDAAGNWTYTLDNAAANVQQLKGGDTVTDTITVTSADGTSHAIVVSVHGADEITSADTGTVREDATLTSSGTLTTTGANSFVPATLNGVYGDLVVGSDGAWTYTLHNTDPTVQALAGNSSRTETFTIDVSDGTNTSIGITVLGANDSAAISGTATSSVTEDTALTGGNLTASGTLAVADVDTGEAVFQTPASLAGSYGSFTIDTATGAWTYAANNAQSAIQSLGDGQSLTDSITVHSADGTASQVITVTIHGTNDAATISGTAIGSVTEDTALTGGNLTASGTLAVADVDTGEAVFQTPASLAGTYGNFTFNTATGAWTYAANNGQSAIQSLGDGESLTDSITAQSADGSASQVITVTIHGTNDGAVISGTDSGSVAEDTALTTAGKLDVADADAGQASFNAQTNVAGAHGTFSIDASGNWTYALDNTDPAVQALGAGQSLPSEVFTVTSLDGTTHTVTVAITGTNDAAVVTPVTMNLTETNAALTTGGTLAITDIDSAATFVAQTNVAGSNGYGHFNVGTNGAWTWTADSAHNEFVAGQHYSDSITVTSADGTTSTITVDILGTNDAAVITGTATGSVTEDTTLTGGNLTASGTLAVADVDTGEAVFQTPASLVGTYGSFTFDTTTGAWTYAANNAQSAIQSLGDGESLTDSITVQSADGSASQVITVTIHGTNDAATISGSDTGSVIEDATLATSGKLDVADIDAGQASFNAQTNVAGAHGTFSIDAAGNWTYALDNADPAVQALGAGQSLPSEVFNVTSLDGTTHTVTVAITGTNDAAAISGAASGSVIEDTTLVASGKLDITDPDAGQSSFVAGSHTGTYGSLTIDAAGHWTYTLDNAAADVQQLKGGDTVTDTITVTSADGTSHAVVVSVHGADEITSADTGTVREDATLTSSGTLTTTGANSFVPATLNGVYGDLVVGSDGAWTYTLHNTDPTVQALAGNSSRTETFTVDVSDGTNTSISVTVLGSNDAAVITPATANLTETNAVLTTGGTLAITDIDSAATFVAQTNVAGSNGYGHFNVGTDGAWTWTADSAHNEFVAGQHYSDSITVTSADGTTSTITVDILGTNDAAVITPVTVNLTETNAVLTTGGTLAISDVDSPATFVAQTNVAGSNGFGHFNVGTDGAWTWTADSAHNEFVAGQHYTDSITVTSADGTTSTITVDILGTNDVPAIGGASTGAVTEAGGLNNATAGVPAASGTLTIADDEAGQSSFQAPPSLAGIYGNFTFNASTGAWTYALDNSKAATQALNAGATVHDTLTVTSTDGSGTQTIDVTITGANDNATITGTSTASVMEDTAVSSGNLTASGMLAASDVDAGQDTFAAPTTLTGTYGSFTFNTATGAWTYSASNSQAAVQQLGAGQSLTDSIIVKSLDGTASQTITVTINGSNDAATITGTNTASVAEDTAVTAGKLTASGTLAVSDADNGQDAFATPATLTGTYGSFTFNSSTGAWTYAADNAQSAIQALGAGQSLTDSIVAKSVDGTASQTITVTINGTNDVPVIGGTSTASVTEDASVASGNLTASGVLTIADADNGQSSFEVPASLTGTYGTFTFDTATGAWTYAASNSQTAVQQLGAGQSLTDSIVVKSLDGAASHTIMVTINGTNDTAVIGGTATGSVTEDTAVSAGKISVSGALTVSDVDAGQAIFQAPATLTGIYGSFTFNTGTGTWTYSADNSQTAIQSLGAGQTLTDSIVVKSLDGSASQTITVTINGANDIAKISGSSTAAVTEDVGLTGGNLTASGTLAVSDGDAGENTFATPATLAGTYGTFTFSTATGAWIYAASNSQTAVQQLGAGQSLTDSVVVKSLDGTATQTITVTINGTNDVPTIGGTSTDNVVEAGGLNNATAGAPNASGTLTISDADSGQSSFQTPASLSGTYGNFTFNASTGAWTYALDNSKTATQALAAGATVHDTLTVTSLDGTTTEAIDVTVTGANDNATITGTSTGSVTEDTAVTSGNLTTSGTLAVSDVDASQTGFATPATLTGAYGTFTFNTATGAWTYSASNAQSAIQSLGADQSLTDSIVVTSLDGSASQTITVTINGTNDGPVLDLDANNSTAGNADYTATFTENGAAVSIADSDISISDVDSNIQSATITLTNAQSGDVLSVGSLPAGITASVLGNVVTLSGGASLASYQAAIRAVTYASTSENPDPADRVITVTVNDGSLNSNTATATIHVVPVNDAPSTTGGNVTGSEDQPLVLNWSQFNVTDVDGGPAPAIVITSLPGNGVLQYSTNGVTWTSISTTGQTVLKSNIDLGYLRFVPAANESGIDAYGGTGSGNKQADYASFGYQVVDGSSVNGTGNSGTLVVDIAPVADAPTVTLQLGAPAFTQTGTTSGRATGYDTYSVSLSATLLDTDGSETLSSVRVFGLPSGATLSAGAQQTDGSWVLTQAQLPGLTVRVPTGSASFTMTASATATEGANNNQATASATASASTDHGTIAVADAATAIEAGGTGNSTAGTNPSGNVLTNDLIIDSGDGKLVSAVAFGGTTGTVGSALAGAYGTLTLNANGTYSYVVNNSNGAVQALRTSSNTLTETFTYATTDANGTGASSTTLTITIQGADDAPVAVADTNVVTRNNNNQQTISTTVATGVLTNDTDVDSGDTEQVSAITKGGTTQTIAAGGSTTITGTYGNLTIYSDGHYTYTTTGSRPGTDVQDVFTYTVRDTAGLTSQATLTINVDRANTAPTASAGAVAGTEDTPLVFTWANFNVADADGVSSSLGVTVRSLPTDGVLQTSTDGVTWTTITATNTTVLKSTIDAGNFRFVPDANESGSNAYSTAGTGNMRTDYASFTYRGTDGSLNSGDVTMTMDIAPVADDAKLAVGGVAVIDGAVLVATPPPSEGLTVRQYTSIPNISTTTVDTDSEVRSLLSLLDANTANSTSISNAPQNYVTGSGSPSGIPTDGAYRVTGLIYMEAGHTYTFSSYMDDTALLSIGGTVVLAKNYNSWGNITASNFVPTTTGYYTLDWAVYNGDSVGALKPYLSVDGGTAQDLTTSNFKIYSSVGSLESLGGVHDNFVSISGSGGYYPVSNSGVEDTIIKLSPIAVSLSDTDGSEALVSLVAKNLLVGSVLSDGTRSFTATAGNTSVDITGWTLGTMTIKPPQDFFGNYGLELVATSKETATGELATNSTTLTVPVAGVADAPTAVGDSVSLTEDSGNYVASGNVLANDSDRDGDTIHVSAVNNQAALLGASVAGSYGYFQINADGSYSYSLLNDNAHVNALNNGQSLTDRVTYTATDATGMSNSATLTVTINGSTDSYSPSNTLAGTAGADTLIGTASADSINSLAGNDYVEAGGGHDVVRTGDAASSTAQAQLAASTFMTQVDASMTNASGQLTMADATHKSYGDLANGGDGNDALIGTGTGSHLLYGGAGNDYLLGGSASDALRGGAGSDRIEGGAGADVMRGDLGPDTFVWSLGDQAGTPGTTGAAAGNIFGVAAGVQLSSTTDLITDFSKAEGDALDLRDLLAGENHLGLDTGNLSSYLHFELSNGNTVVHVSTTGGFTGGTYDATKEDQTIVLQNVNLLHDGAASLLNDNAVIQDLLKNNRLVTD